MRIADAILKSKTDEREQLMSKQSVKELNYRKYERISEIMKHLENRLGKSFKNLSLKRYNKSKQLVSIWDHNLFLSDLGRVSEYLRFREFKEGKKELSDNYRQLKFDFYLLKDEYIQKLKQDYEHYVNPQIGDK